MARELILHIGHFKTGTTALQSYLDYNRDLLAEAGLHYAAETRKHAKHSALAFSLLRRAGVSELMHGYASPRPPGRIWQALFHEARALPDGHSLLVSSEEFIRLGAHPAAATLLRQQINQAPDLRFRVIAYLRPPQAHLQSWYNQLVKMGIPVGSFATALSTQMEPIHWDYALALKPWLEIFGAEAVILRPYDPSLREGDALYADFLGALGFPVPPLAEPMPGDPNRRIDPRRLAYHRGLNRVDLPRHVRELMNAHAQASLDSDDGDGPGRALARIRDEARRGIEAVAALPGAALDAETMLAALPDLPEDPAQDLDALIALMAGEIGRLRAHVVSLSGRIGVLEEAARREATPKDPRDPEA